MSLTTVYLPVPEAALPAVKQANIDCLLGDESEKLWGDDGFRPSTYWWVLEKGDTLKTCTTHGGYFGAKKLVGVDSELDMVVNHARSHATPVVTTQRGFEGLVGAVIDRMTILSCT